MAKLAAERLDRGADAIALYKAILDEDPARGRRARPLEKQAERDKDFATVAEVARAAHRARRRRHGAPRRSCRSSAASTPIGWPTTPAPPTWRRVLELSPGHAKALRVLRDSYLASNDFDGLEELYASQNDWEGLVEVLSTAADRATEPEAKVDLSFRAARILTDKLGARARLPLLRARALGAPRRRQRRRGARADLRERREVVAAARALRDAARRGAGRRREARALAPPRRRHRRAARRAGGRGPVGPRPTSSLPARSASTSSKRRRAPPSWELFVDAVAARLKKKKGVADEERRTLKAKLARLHATELGRLDDAISEYRRSSRKSPATKRRSPRSTGSFARRSPRRSALALRASRHAGRRRLARRDPRRVGEPRGRGLRRARARDRALSPRPRGRRRNELAARTLPRLLLAGGQRARGRRGHRSAPRDDRRRRARRARARARRHLPRSPLASPAQALEAAARALEAVPHDPRAVAMLDRLVALPETRAKAAELLEAEYAESGDARREAQALGVLLETTHRRRTPARALHHARRARRAPALVGRARVRRRRCARSPSFPPSSSSGIAPACSRRERLARPISPRPTAMPCAETPTFRRRSRSSSASAPPRCTTRSSAIPRARRRTSSASSRDAGQRARLHAPEADPHQRRELGRARGALRAGRQGHDRSAAPRRAAQRGRPHLRRDHRRSRQGHRLLRAHPRARVRCTRTRPARSRSSTSAKGAGKARRAPRAPPRDRDAGRDRRPQAAARPDRSRSAPRAARALSATSKRCCGSTSDIPRRARARRAAPRHRQPAHARGRILEAVYDARDEIRDLVRVLEIRLEGADDDDGGASSCGASPACATSACTTTRARSTPSRGSCRSSPTTSPRAIA